MKNLLASLLFLIGIALSVFGAPQPQSPDSINNAINTETFLYDHLGFGSHEAMWNFALSQIHYITVGVFDPEDETTYITSDPYPIWDYETLEEAVIRIFNEELNRKTSIVENKELEVLYYLDEPSGGGQFYGKMKFVPEKVLDGIYIIPNSITNKLDMQLIGTAQPVWWPHIKRAILTVFDHNGNVHNYDSLKADINKEEFSVIHNLVMLIPRRLVTNGYTGRLTIALDTGVSATYLLEDGSFVFYPQSIKPLLGITMKTNSLVLSINGAPFQQVSLLSTVDLNRLASEEIITLNNVGSIVLTNKITTPVRIFSVKYLNESKQ